MVVVHYLAKEKCLGRGGGEGSCIHTLPAASAARVISATGEVFLKGGGEGEAMVNDIALSEAAEGVCGGNVGEGVRGGMGPPGLRQALVKGSVLPPPGGLVPGLVGGRRRRWPPLPGV